MAACCDFAFMLSRLLFQHYPLPPTLDDVRQAAQTPEAPDTFLTDILGLDSASVQLLQTLLDGCTCKGELEAVCAAQSSAGDVEMEAPLRQLLTKLMPRLAADDAHAERAFKEATEVFDNLVSRHARGSLALALALSLSLAHSAALDVSPSPCVPSISVWRGRWRAASGAVACARTARSSSHVGGVVRNYQAHLPTVRDGGGARVCADLKVQRQG